MNILAIGAHPDDVELGCAGTLIKHANLGDNIYIADLTQGELGSRGTIDTRYEEADKAAQIMGVKERINLKFRDGFFQNDEQHQLAVIQVIRKYKPDVIIGNAYYDRHPDHGRACDLIETACFLSGLVKIETELDQKPQMPWRPSRIFHYIQDRYISPDFVVDISNTMEQKMASVMAYQTQFISEKDTPNTYINQPGFIDNIKSRAIQFGHSIGAQYGEGFLSRAQIGIADLHSFTYPKLS